MPNIARIETEKKLGNRAGPVARWSAALECLLPAGFDPAPAPASTCGVVSVQEKRKEKKIGLSESSGLILFLFFLFPILIAVLST
jgi:hypothetical protein